MTLDVSSSRETGMSRQMFLDIFDTAIESIVLFDSSGIIMEVNHAFIHALGIPKKEIVGKNMRDLISQIIGDIGMRAFKEPLMSRTIKGR